ncbi:MULTISPECIES: HetZ-related protein 2 [Moorena]|uniref:HetZ-related protein 2 n=2 Tax=Moorena TaxID=1155738 RepID=F4XL02_9CYAN|nr:MULTISPECIES: HetZ-related protein 2 [Moorena]NEQ12718.1 HetZ-related protein 2 [Moorena sp. SIO3E2]NES80863.1 HetZ-related protein 2 [Moorena sp. SIO2B7]EGJ34692.1 hypothetical protein LYNGBM3L_13390 [Moorena producens 3L]NEP34581.1 HetZ-related protein 2 [Moorena sp. SIO3B2]NEP68700.1 HetZ-related protein 2 [Moorena sp. SIO3A5]
MQTLKQGSKECNVMAKLADKLEREWQSRLLSDCPNQNPAISSSIVQWLIGEDKEGFDTLTQSKLAIAVQAMEYRYRILQQRYLGVPPERSYRNLTTRLASLVTLRNKIRTWVSLSRDRQRAVVDVLQEVIQELLNSDRYIQKQIAWIRQCTFEEPLRNALLLTTLEEYCLRPIRNQPLVVYRFVNFLRRSQRGGMTHVPEGDMVRLVSESINPEGETDAPVSLLDNQAITNYQHKQAWEEKQSLRMSVSKEFEAYLEKNLGSEAALWLRLYLQGQSQEAIARRLNWPIKKVYRLREKISYHAIRVFSINGVKGKPDLVASWLETSYTEHSFGLTPRQWQEYQQKLTPEQQQLLDKLKAGHTFEAIANDLNWRSNQVMGEWNKLYLAAQALRSASAS